jgi:hypothetical protein
MVGNNDFSGEIPRNFCDLEELEIVSVDCQSQGDCDCCTECAVPSMPTLSPSISPVMDPTFAPSVAPDVCEDTVTVFQPCLAPGEDIGVVLSNCLAEEDDWLGVYPVDEDVNNLPNPIVWSWACGSRNCREAVEENTFSLNESHAGSGNWPLPEGTYMVAMARNSAQPYVAYAQSVSFTIQDNCWE